MACLTSGGSGILSSSKGPPGIACIIIKVTTETKRTTPTIPSQYTERLTQLLSTTPVRFPQAQTPIVSTQKALGCSSLYSHPQDPVKRKGDRELRIADSPGKGIDNIISDIYTVPVTISPKHYEIPLNHRIVPSRETGVS